MKSKKLTIAQKLKIMDILKYATNLLKDKTRWTQDCFARSKSGREVGIESKSACQWCVSGAVYKAEKALFETEALWFPTINYLDKFTNDPDTGVVMFNDRSKHAQVLKLLRTASADLKQSLHK